MHTPCPGRGSPASPGTAASGQSQGAEVEAEQEARPRPLCHGAEHRSFELEDIPDTSPGSCHPHARLHLATRVEMEAGPPLSPHPRSEVRLSPIEVI